MCGEVSLGGTLIIISAYAPSGLFVFVCPISRKRTESEPLDSMVETKIIEVYIVRTQENTCSSDSRFRRKLGGTTGHRLLGTQRPQLLCVAAWVWFCLTAEFVGRHACIYVYIRTVWLVCFARPREAGLCNESEEDRIGPLKLNR